jgi:hypothetical protein
LDVLVADDPATLKLKTWRRLSDGKNIFAVWNTEPNAPSLPSSSTWIFLVEQFSSTGGQVDAEPTLQEHAGDDDGDSPNVI